MTILVKHKHHEVIKAWADGHAIEWRRAGTHLDWNPVGSVPAWEGFNEYRVRPEKVRLYVAMFSQGPGTKYYESLKDLGLSCRGHLNYVSFEVDSSDPRHPCNKK